MGRKLLDSSDKGGRGNASLTEGKGKGEGELNRAFTVGIA